MSTPTSFKVVLDSLYDGVYVVDRDRRIDYWNNGAERITGHLAGAVIGRHCHDNILKHVDEEGTLLCHTACPLAQTMADGQPREVQVYLSHADGHRVPVLVRAAPLHDDQGRVVGAVEVFSDNSSMMALVHRAKELDQALIEDPLTRVGSRRFIEAKLQAMVNETRRYGHPAGLLVVDIDHFKRVNDTYGHDVGDRVLATIARTLDLNIRESDQLGRWGGEEFVAVILNVGEGQMVALANKLRELVARSSVEAGDARVAVTISIGATLIRADDTPEAAFKRADALLYQSKREGRNRVSFAE